MERKKNSVKRAASPESSGSQGQCKGQKVVNINVNTKCLSPKKMCARYERYT